MQVEVRHLRTVIAVADSGGISAAGLQLNIEPSAVSRIVHELEDWLGVCRSSNVTRVVQSQPRPARLTSKRRGKFWLG
jgi:hypothetical protein